MVYITASPLVFFCGLLLIVGISGWLGYLLGRVRTLDPHVRTPYEQARASFVFGSLLVLLALGCFFLVFGEGIPRQMDGAGALIASLATFALLLGGYKMVAAMRDVQPRA